MELIKTTIGTARLLTDDGMYMEDLNLGIVRTYPLLTANQIDDLRIGYSTPITDDQVNSIKELAGV